LLGLSVTDQPRECPSGPIPSTEREKHVILSLTAPSPSHAGVTIPLVAAVFAFIDGLHRINLRPETKSKLKKLREDVDKELKEKAEKSKKEDESQAVDDKKTAKRKAEEERISRLSAIEQKKVLDRDRKRSYRKMQSKTARK